MVNNIRFKIIDDSAAVSFVAPAHLIKMLVAACARRPETAEQLLDFARPYDPDTIDTVRSGLAVFDEHNTRGNTRAFNTLADSRSPSELPPFRVLDERTREFSTEPTNIGLIIFNLPARRIIQVQNSYAEVQRTDRGRIWRDGEPTPQLYHYRLPEEWSIVP